MATTWILVAHRSGARLFESRGDRALLPVESIDHPAGRRRPHELETDRPGRSFDRMGGQRHGMSKEDSPTEHLAVEFAAELAAHLKSAHEAKRFDRLLLVAGPKLLGHLRDALDKHTAAAVGGSLDRDLGETPDAELPAHLAGLL
jgi:protein required for attachment to host cells